MVVRGLANGTAMIIPSLLGEQLKEPQLGMELQDHNR